MLAVAAALVVTPLAVAARPAADSGLSARLLASRILASDRVTWSGLVRSSGSLAAPSTDSFAGLGDLFGADNDLRVWWRAPDDWRIDRIRSTGETDVFSHGGYLIRWEFESRTATAAPVSKIRLPDVSDLVPANLARFALAEARDSELSRLPARRIAGVDAAGVRLAPDDRRTSVGHVDVWADPASGLPLRVELTGSGTARPVLTTAVTQLRLGPVDQRTTVFLLPADVSFRYDQSVDVAAEANALVPYRMPTTLAGLPLRTGLDRGAAGVYGRGPTFLIAVSLRGQVAGPLRDRLRESAASRRTEIGRFMPVGPVGLFLTSGRLDPRGEGGGFLVIGTATSEVLQQAARELLGRQ